jgi:hypothetical protein
MNRPNLLPILKSCRLMLVAYLGYRDKMLRKAEAQHEMGAKWTPFTELIDLIRDTEAAIAMAEDMGERRSWRVRRCAGHYHAWILIGLRPDGTERDSYGSFRTALSLNDLMADKAVKITRAKGP